MSKNEEIYIRMRPPRFSYARLSELPQSLIPLYDTIRTIEEWKSLGYIIKFSDEYELNIEQFAPAEYEFIRILNLTSDIKKAILNKKKHIKHCNTLIDYVRIGCGFDNFSELPEHQKNFCLGIFELEKNNLSEAFAYFEMAVSEEPKEVRYRERYYEIGLKLGKLDLIQNEIEYFRCDIDVSIHTGRFDAWVNSLIDSQRLNDAKSVMIQVERYLQSLVDGKVEHLYYAKSGIYFYESKMEKLKKSIEKYSKKIKRLESLKN